MTKKQKADTVSKKKIEMKTSILQGITYLVHQEKVVNDKKTIEENNIGAEATIEMSLRLLGGMEENVVMESLESEDESTRPSDDAMFLRREIFDAITRSSEKIETYLKKADEKYGQI